MEIKHLNSFILKNKVERHDEVKDKLMDLIVNNESGATEYDGGFISRTDYHLDENHTRTYLPLFFEIIEPILQEQSNFFMSKEANVHHAWFQQYYKSQFHSPHNHGALGYSSVTYIKFNKDIHQPTVFIAPFNDPLGNLIEFAPDIDEGQIIFFPAMITHYVLPSKTNDIRIILSLNVRGN